ncbi:PepSY-associated TM helix domain-containing protein [Xanthobacter agilis]|uniref:Iron-regulated membrane protein n=1 Tax=Xanthobacter agilis TaxID=47492 RepID=A0ABU0LIQ0_XANAG|nr:PepSY-associated TM helix domain-containing protein [Xanthobacter agilis]MDQ0507001.1 putative iron-regulated membrane protein [Xanthobacter agilis]
MASSAVPVPEGPTPAVPRPRVSLRPGLVWVHRVAGLTTALFLLLAGLTGSLLAFHEEIDRALNPTAYDATARGLPLSPEALARAVEAGDPRRQVWYITLERQEGHAALVVAMGKADPATGAPYALTSDWFNVDPVSGAVLAERLWGECCFGPLNFIPFIYEFHHNLSLPGAIGVVFMGVVAIIWLVDGFVGLALTFPRGRPFLAKWRPAFRIKGGSTFRLNLDLHRAAGLWLFVFLILIAITSVSMNLRSEVVEPVVGLFSKVTPPPFSGPPLAQLRERTVSYDAALNAGLREAEDRGWRGPPSEIFYSPQYGIFGVAFGDHDDPMGANWLYLSGDQATPIGAMVPGAGTAGDIFMQLQFPIHSGRILGLPGRILIAAMGGLIAMLSVTGVAVWWMKRKGRKGRAAKAGRPKAVAAE